MTDGTSGSDPVGATDREWWTGLEREERNTLTGLGLFAGVLVAALLIGALSLSYLLYLLSLAGMYVLLTMGLNVQWGYTGLVNFSVIAFWGVGAYSAALLTASRSPLGLELSPVWGVVAAVVAAAVLATLVAVPTLRLREDYLAIATLGFAEIVRMVINNERALTGGSAGIAGVPSLFESLPLSQQLVDFGVVAALVGVTYLLLRRARLSPWGRVLRTVRADEDLAQALGKNTFRFKLQAFVLGSVVMALAGVFYVHFISYVNPNGLDPIRTFYVWIGVILGGSGSNRGAVVGGLSVVAIREAPSFIKEALTGLPAIGQYVAGLNVGALQLFFVGVLVIAITRYRSSGLLPPKRETIWPAALEDDSSSALENGSSPAREDDA